MGQDNILGVVMSFVAYDFGINFADMWAAALSFLTGALLGPLVLTLGGMFIAFLCVTLLVRVIGANK